jgi:putative monooxygenase
MLKDLAKNYIIKTEDVEPMTDKGGEVILLLSPKTTGMKNLIMGVGITPVNGEVAEHVHDYGEECFFVIQGKGKLYLEDEEVIDFEEGSAVRVPQGVRHRVVNTGPDILKVVFATAPLAPVATVGHRNTIK